MRENASDQGAIGFSLHLIDREGGASFLDQSNTTVKQNQFHPGLLSTLNWKLLCYLKSERNTLWPQDYKLEVAYDSPDWGCLKGGLSTIHWKMHLGSLTFYPLDISLSRSLRALTSNTCYRWAHLMLRVIKVERLRWQYKYYCEMLQVNLHLLWLLQSLLTTLVRYLEDSRVQCLNNQCPILYT